MGEAVRDWIPFVEETKEGKKYHMLAKIPGFQSPARGLAVLRDVSY